MKQKIVGIFFSVVAMLSLMIGLVVLISPLPFGGILALVSFSFLVYFNRTVQRWLRFLRTRFVWVNSRMFWLEKHLGGKIKFVRLALQKTHPLDFT